MRENIRVIKPGHAYAVSLKGLPAVGDSVAAISFQDGTVPEVGRNGVTNEEVLEILVDRMECLNRNFPCYENDMAIIKLEEALHWLNHRTQKRLERGVEGKHIR